MGLYVPNSYEFPIHNNNLRSDLCHEQNKRRPECNVLGYLKIATSVSSVIKALMWRRFIIQISLLQI